MAMRAAERQRRWRQKNPDASKSACRAYHAANASVIVVRKAAYYQDVRKREDATPLGLLRDRDRKARRRSQTGEGSVSAAEWVAIVALHNSRCAYCGRDDLPLEQDHVVALSKGGEHAASNILPACKPCNSRKGAR